MFKCYYNALLFLYYFSLSLINEEFFKNRKIFIIIYIYYYNPRIRYFSLIFHSIFHFFVVYRFFPNTSYSIRMSIIKRNVFIKNKIKINVFVKNKFTKIIQNSVLKPIEDAGEHFEEN